MICEPWLTVADVCEPDQQVPPGIARNAIASATAWMFEATCSQFTGVCTTRIRPQLPCGHTDGDCACSTAVRRIDLSPWVSGPVRSIVDVVVNGEAIPEEDYRLGMGRYLIPHEGGALSPIWPAQHPNRDIDAEGTWYVLVTHGHVAPAHVLDATADLARQLILKCTGGQCDLPDNVTSIQRDGMSIELNIPTDGKTGLPVVDTVISMYPCKRTRRLYDPADYGTETVRVTGGM